ncbi:MAG: EAL domain-containing protein [Bacilli bacterium]|nr:EAL domain-containing protein [Bacilli bacterium]
MFTQLNINAGLSFGAMLVALFCVISSARKNLTRFQHGTYFIICLSALASGICMFAEEFFLTFSKAGDESYIPFFTIEFLFFFFHSFFAPAYALYVLSLNGTIAGRNKNIWYAYWTPVFLVELLNVVNIFIPSESRPLYTIVTTAEGGYAYQRGNLMFILYVVAFAYVLFGIIAFFKNIKALNSRKITTIILFNIFTLLGVFFQMIWVDVKFECIFESMSILAVLLLLENDNDILDPNTNLYNQIGFFSDSEVAMAANRKFSIITLMTGDFFQYLEMLGKEKIDGIEVEMAKFLKSAYHSSYIYHLQNGKYALIVYENKKVKAMDIAEQIKERLQKPWSHEQIEGAARWTITIARVPEDIDKPSQLHYLFLETMVNSDEKVILRSGNDLRFIQRRSKVEAAIARGLQDNNFKLYYQPIWDVKRNKIVSAEALLRLIDPEIGLISPVEFIPIAEEKGSIIEIGHWVFEEACRFARRNDIKNLGIGWLEINLSVHQLPERNLAGRFLETAHRYGIEPSFLNIEITESADVDDNDELAERIETLANVGFPLSLDDYGTGYSNLTRVIRSKFRNIKLDRSLLLSAEIDKAGQTVLASTYDTMNSLSFHTIQEGVETEEQKELVINYGAEMIQGFFFSKPIPEKEFIEYVIKFNDIEYIA